MPKIASTEELSNLAARVGGHPAGIGLSDLFRETGSRWPRRTLQRRLSALVSQGRLVSEGVARSVKYRLAPITGTLAVTLSASVAHAEAEVYVPLSAEGQVIKTHVRQTLQQRRPVSYEMRFLEDYQPNQSFYLPDVLRRQLHLLGRAPVEHVAAGTFAREILDRLLIDLSWASSRLEGNTYTRLDTERLIGLGQVAEGKDALETQMILNHKAAIEYLVGEVDRVGVNVETILALHALLSDGLLRDPRAGGRVRSRPVEIGGSVYRPIAMPQRLEELFALVISMAAEIDDPFEQAFFLMVHMPYLQPFEDVNKRVSRLAANIPLIRHNLCPLSFIDVPQQAYVDAMLGVYELNRVELLRDVFVWAYERSCQQYLAVRQQLIPPDTFRLRYRAELTSAVRAVVRGDLRMTEVSLRSVVPESVADADRARFVTLMQDEFKSLHAGNAVRFGLRPLELAAWQQTLDALDGIADKPGAKL